MFAAPDVGFFIDGGSLYLSSDVAPLTGADLHGFGAPNRATAAGTFTTAGDVQTLTIPIETTFSLSVLNADDLTLTFSGQIVATRAVPEPTPTLLLLCACGALLAGRLTARRNCASRAARG